MSKNKIIKVSNTEITILSKSENDFISLTDMIKAKDGEFFISDWLRNRNTIEFLSVWETLNNPSFNYGEFAIITKSSGLNTFKISVKEWIEKTGAIGISAKTGRYGGTYAHKDIAFEFGMWISPMFKLLLIKEFQRLKDEESKTLNSEWDYRRFISKVNYKVHTDSIKENIIPYSSLPKEKEGLIYAEEADVLNVALFGMTAKEWKQKYPQLVLEGLNIRDLADLHQLTVLSNLESLNSIFIKQGINQGERLKQLRSAANDQMKSLQNSSYTIAKIKSPFNKPSDLDRL